jgi:hypothetical protein
MRRRNVVTMFLPRIFHAAIHALVLCLVCATASAETPKQRVDLELVLALDASSSIDIGEYGLQLRGIARAFRDPDIQGAINAGPEQKIAINVIVWAQGGFSKLDAGWSVISSPADAEAFATKIEKLPRRQFGGTAIGDGIAASLDSLAHNSFEAPRRTIDVSGDGRESETSSGDFPLLAEARERAARMGVTINGLAIIDDDPSLLDYYSSEIRTGPGSFVISARDYVDFESAIRLKLFREILGGQRMADAAR